MVKMTSQFRNKVGTLDPVLFDERRGRDGLTAGYYMCRYAGCTFEGERVARALGGGVGCGGR